MARGGLVGLVVRSACLRYWLVSAVLLDLSYCF
jgi:hypothetical protein